MIRGTIRATIITLDTKGALSEPGATQMTFKVLKARIRKDLAP